MLNTSFIERDENVASAEAVMRLKLLALAAGLTVVVGYLAMPPMTVIAATPQLAEKADDVVLTNLKIGKDGEISGEVANTAKQTVRDVELQILYSWRWQDEFHPGQDDPGRAVYVKVDPEIAPGQSAPFNYKPAPPVPSRKDGYFEITVKFVGFPRVYR
jgi:hypothetical protein